MTGKNDEKMDDNGKMDDDENDYENDYKNETSNTVEKYKLTITGEITIDNKNKKISTKFNEMDIDNNGSLFKFNFTKEGIEFQPDDETETDPLSETLKTYTVNFSDISEFKITKWETTRKIEDVEEVDQLTKAAEELYVKVNRELQMPDVKKLLSEKPKFKEIVEDAKKMALSDKTIDEKAVTKMSPEEYLVFLTLTEQHKTEFIKYKKSWIPNPFSTLKPAAAKSFKATRGLSRLAGVRGGRRKTKKNRKYK